MNQLTRTTQETTISIELNLYGEGSSTIDTPVGFFNHMLTLLAFHAGIDLVVKAHGDVDVDAHHLVEDVGIVLGTLFHNALDKQGIRRYGQQLMPMDETLTLVALDVSGRSHLEYYAPFTTQLLGSMASELIEEFLLGFVRQANVTLHIRNLTFKNNHHLAESIFKGLGRVIREAKTIEGDRLPSTKGVL